jgi:hypothetical protein
MLAFCNPHAMPVLDEEHKLEMGLGTEGVMYDLAMLLGHVTRHLGLAVVAVWFVSPLVPFHSPMPELIPLRPTRVHLAVQTLKDADRLCAAQIGYSGLAPSELLAWRIIVHTPGRDSIFAELIRSPSRVTQLYGLIGLKLTNQDLYEVAARGLALDQSLVPTTIGCIVSDSHMADVLVQIREGIWTREFLTGRFNR